MADDAGNHYLIAKDYRKRSGALGIYGCKLEEHVLESMTAAYAGIALIDACRERAADELTRGDGALQASTHHGWGNIRNIPHAQGSLMICHACAPHTTAADGIGHGAFTCHILQVTLLPHPQLHS